MGFPMASALEQGSIFAGRYRVLGRIATGGMGAIYEVVHLETARRRALKIMLPGVLSNEELRERFIREAKVGAQVDSDFIVDVVDAGIDEATESPFLVMELLRGEDLGRRLDRLGKLDPLRRGDLPLPRRARAGRDAPRLRRPPRREAGEPLPHGAGGRSAAHQGARFRGRQGDRGEQRRRRDAGGRHPAVHGAGAVRPARQDHGRGRRVLAGHGGVRAPRRRGLLGRGGENPAGSSRSPPSPCAGRRSPRASAQQGAG